MLIIENSVETQAKPENIWKLWADVPNWNKWDHGIEFSTLEGPFKAGSIGTLKPKGGPLVKTMLTKVEPMKCFVDESKLFLAKIIVSHFLTKTTKGLQVTHKIEMNGPLAFFFAYVIGRTMKKNLPLEMETMVKQAESMS